MNAVEIEAGLSELTAQQLDQTEFPFAFLVAFPIYGDLRAFIAPQ